MPTCFFRLCLILSFFLYAGCLGGPKVDPPGISDERNAGPEITGSSGSSSKREDSMDSGIAPTTNENPAGANGQNQDDSEVLKSDGGLTEDDDDAGSVQEP